MGINLGSRGALFLFPFFWTRVKIDRMARLLLCTVLVLLLATSNGQLRRYLDRYTEQISAALKPGLARLRSEAEVWQHYRCEECEGRCVTTNVMDFRSNAGLEYFRFKAGDGGTPSQCRDLVKAYCLRGHQRALKSMTCTKVDGVHRHNIISDSQGHLMRSYTWRRLRREGKA